MTKQEQIKEIANIIADCRFTDPESEAIDLYNAKCRIVHENSVVLSREELEKLTEEINFWHKINETALILTKEECDNKTILNDNDFEKIIRDVKKKTQKETAREMLKQMYHHCFEIVDPYDNDCEECFGSCDVDYIMDIAKQYGVEIEGRL